MVTDLLKVFRFGAIFSQEKGKSHIFALKYPDIRAVLIMRDPKATNSSFVRPIRIINPGRMIQSDQIYSLDPDHLSLSGSAGKPG